MLIKKNMIFLSISVREKIFYFNVVVFFKNYNYLMFVIVIFFYYVMIYMIRI